VPNHPIAARARLPQQRRLLSGARSAAGVDLQDGRESVADLDRYALRQCRLQIAVGGQNQLSVGVSTDGILVVKVPAAMRAASDDRSLALIGMATAKERLDVQPANVKSVVIQVE
jgi:hypothetical protein